jgi:hypothetical protein
MADERNDIEKAQAESAVPPPPKRDIDINQAQDETQPPPTPKDVERMERSQDETAQSMDLGKDSAGNPTAGR